ncbi:MAG TPA: RidA family protein [Gaiellaceae bacterium]|nr:RidA family protein [Gaiellaceae bacterium]
MKQAIQPEGLARPAAPYSPVVVSGDLVYTAGQVGFDESGQLTADDITGQTKQVFKNLVACLRAGGCEPSDVLKVNAYLADLGDFAAFNEVYRATFQEPYPARTTVGVSLPGGILVEVEAIARRPG